MATLVFDIETVGVAVDELDAAQREYLFREVERLPDERARAERRAEIQRMLSLWPLTARIVCVAMLNADTEKGMVLHLPGDTSEAALQAYPSIEFITCAEERALLERFWDVAKHYDQVVTFNGRAFDVPFLYLRSAILNVPISRKDWLGSRYQAQPHCDLAEQLTFFGVSGREGAARRFNLDFYCKVFGVQSPKARGITGMDVADLVRQGRMQAVAEYCLWDVQATLALYRIWKERLSGIK